MAFITDNVCEEVILCEPNEIIQICLPEGEGIECAYTEILTVPASHYYQGYGWNNHDDAAGADPETDSDHDVEFEVDRMVRSDGGSDFYHAKFNGGVGNDWISGIGLLAFLRDEGGQTAASTDPSLLRGLPIHFEINGGEGNDRIEGANNGDILNGDSGNDKIYGLAGDDRIKGGTGDDYIEAGDGNDIVSGGADNDSIYGGEGDDQLNGGAGNDHIHGDGGNDNIVGGAGYDNLSGGDGNDWMSGGDDDDKMSGGDGDDCMDGGLGDDTMYGGNDNDIMLGGEGDDYMAGDDGDDQLEGGAGNDEVYGGYGNDLVSGGDGNDYVSGGYGDDIVRGGLGDDVLRGGEGCDQFVFCEIDWDCFDKIEDFSVTDRDQIDIKELDIDTVRVVDSGYDNSVFLDLLVDGETAGRILVENEDGANLHRVFSYDTSFSTDEGALVQVGSGVMIDLPSTSIIFVDDGMFI